MSTPLTVNGTTYQFPQQFDKNWGPVVTNWASAVTSGMLQTTGVNTFALLKSSTASPAQSGNVRLARVDVLSWRNQLGNADLPLGVNSGNQLTFNGVPIGASAALTDGHIFVGNVSNQPTDVAMSGDVTINNTGVTALGSLKVFDANVNASAAIAVSKLAALTASRIVVTDGSGVLFIVTSPDIATSVG